MNDKLEELKKEKVLECETCACHHSKWCEGYTKALEDADKIFPDTVRIDGDLNILGEPEKYKYWRLMQGEVSKSENIECDKYHQARKITLLELVEALKAKEL